MDLGNVPAQGDPAAPEFVSVVLPAAQAGKRFEQTVEGLAAALEGLPSAWELILVPSARARDVCDALAARHSSVRSSDSTEERWGAAVRAGLADAGGDLLVFANAGHVSPSALRRVVDLSLAHPGVVLRANRRSRDTWPKRLGSLLFNLECRALLGVATWDVNGTPKAFPRRFNALLRLTRDDELLDAEFTTTTQREGYPTLEVPTREPDNVSGGVGMLTALRMYARLPQLRRDSRAR